MLTTECKIPQKLSGSLLTECPNCNSNSMLPNLMNMMNPRASRVVRLKYYIK